MSSIQPIGMIFFLNVAFFTSFLVAYHKMRENLD